MGSAEKQCHRSRRRQIRTPHYCSHHRKSHYHCTPRILTGSHRHPSWYLMPSGRSRRNRCRSGKCETASPARRRRSRRRLRRGRKCWCTPVRVRQGAAAEAAARVTLMSNANFVNFSGSPKTPRAPRGRSGARRAVAPESRRPIRLSTKDSKPAAALGRRRNRIDRTARITKFWPSAARDSHARHFHRCPNVVRDDLLEHVWHRLRWPVDLQRASARTATQTA